MKDYLSSSERDLFVCFIHMLNNAEIITANVNTYTKEEITNMKKAVTWGKKAMESVICRQNQSSRKALGNMITKTKAFLDYSSLTEIYAKRKMAEIDAAYEDNKEYYRLVELILHYNCRECTGCHSNCEFYKEFEKQMIPNFDGTIQFGECKYSFTPISAEG